ncbi:hypothetical protein GF312_22885 [Candidatus Poribacteria bacterium]|nr:hypothetical protein [Candidatus Poribacteria bacterium]
MADKKIKKTENVMASNDLDSLLRERLSDIIAVVARKINIMQLAAASGTIRDIDIDKVVLGEAKIDKLILQNTTAGVHSGNAFLQDVKILLELKLSLDWWIDIWVYDDSGTENLGSLWFPISVGNVQVPSLENIDLTIPSLSVEDVNANIKPITNLDLGGGSFDDLDAKETTVPADGFQLSGLGLGNFNLSNVNVPRTSTKEAKIERFQPNSDLVLPGAAVSQLQVPAASADNIQSDAILIDGVATKRGISVNFGIFGFTFWVQPVAHMSIGSMLLQDVTLSANIDQAMIESISVPIDIRGIVLKDVELRQINVNNISG